jgi:hypothetical protein
MKAHANTTIQQTVRGAEADFLQQYSTHEMRSIGAIAWAPAARM